MILFHAPYPAKELMNNGMYVRIFAIDQMFKDRERVYFWEDTQLNTVEPEAEYPNELCTFYKINPFITSHRQLIYKLAIEAEFIYCQTQYYSYLVTYLLPTNKLIVDLHGIPPEESLMEKQPEQAKYCGIFEPQIIKGAKCLISVTQSMIDHFHKKYGDFSTDSIVLPIMNDLPANIEKKINKKYRVIYAGDIAAWQNVDQMLEAINKEKSEKYEFIIYTKKQEEMKELCCKYGVEKKIEISSYDNNEKAEVLIGADFGFILREDNPVNRVACPTKLMEYLQFGIIPIVTLEEIGDFKTVGYEYLTLDQFISGSFDDQRLRTMREKNLRVYQQFYQQYITNGEKLKNYSCTNKTSCIISNYDANLGVPLNFIFVFKYKDGNKDYGKEVKKLVTDYNGTLLVEAPAPGFYAVELYFLQYPILMRNFKMSLKDETFQESVSLKALDNGLYCYDGTICPYWLYQEKHNANEIYLKYDIVALRHEVYYFQKEYMEHISKQLEDTKRKIADTLSLIDRIKNSKRARIIKILLMLINPKSVNESNLFSLVFKRIFLRKKIGEHFHIFNEVESVLKENSQDN